MLWLEREAQDALHATSENFLGPAGVVMKVGCFPLGEITRPYSDPGDDLTKDVSRLLVTPSELGSLSKEGIYSAPEGTVHQLTDLVDAVPVCVEADWVAPSLRREKTDPTAEETNLMS